jgi:UDP-2,3-diacylglucosamine pyrophosphatase LpxH
VTAIRYAILSDLHFGAANSVLTTIRPDSSTDGGFRADPDVPSPLIDAMLTGLESLVAGQDTPPTLVLAGDVLDLALSPDEVAATAFSGFVDRAFGTGRSLFAPVVYYLPGNHDHHMWEGTREAAYTRRLGQLGPQEPIPPPCHTTRLSPAELTPSEGDLVSALIHRRPGCAGVEVRVAYPNLALTSDTSSQVQILSHGHYTESIYTLMTRLRRALFPDQVEADETTDVETLEAENFAWIDFFWSTLGRSGEVGIDVSRIYSDLQSPANLNVLATNLSIAFAARPHNPPWLRRAESGLLGVVLRREVRHTARAERGTPDVTLTPNGRQGLRTYLEGAVAAQIKGQLEVKPSRTGFVFGHTHKPFLESWDVQGFPDPMSIANTGGWVVDTASSAQCQGGALVLLDDDLNSSVLVMYQQRPGGVAPAQVLADPGGSSIANPLPAFVTERMAADERSWKTISAAAEPLVAERWQLQANLSAPIVRGAKR